MLISSKNHKNDFRRRKNSKLRSIIIIISIIVVCLAGFVSYSYISSYFKAQHDKQVALQLKKEAVAKAAAIEAKKKEPVYITLPNSTRIRAIVDDYLVTDSIWAIVSKTHPISTEYVPTPLIIPAVETRTDKSDEERSVRLDIEQPLIDMFGAAAMASNQLMIGSGYRSAALQTIYFDSAVDAYGEEVASQAIARPGQSEHQLGLAVDISTVSRECYLENCFGDTADGEWLENNSYKYGFILRYPEGKELITGYQYEPWHFRYVGIDLATAIHESGLTLDEAWPYLETALSTLRQNGAI